MESETFGILHQQLSHTNLTFSYIFFPVAVGNDSTPSADGGERGGRGREGGFVARNELQQQFVPEAD